MNKEKLTAYGNKFKAIRIRVEKNYYATEFRKYKHDLRKTWQLIRWVMSLGKNKTFIESLKIKGIEAKDAVKMANGLNSYFANIASTIALSLAHTPFDFSTYLPTHLNSVGLTTAEDWVTSIPV